MKLLKLLFLLLLLFPALTFSQCTTTNATSCQCPPGGGTNCDLVPDISIARLPLTQASNYTEYPQVCNPPCSGNDGRLRVGVSTPIIGYGPLETRGTSKYVCGTDTVDAGSVANIPATCPITGDPPHQLINQRIYHKNGNTMTFTDRAAGSMTYHPTHGHQHVDDWGIYTLRQSNGDPNPLNWPIIGNGAKLGYCLLDIGSCDGSSGYCTDTTGATLNSSNIVNYGLGGGMYSCSNTVQGISNGYMDTYSQNLDGMWIVIPPGLCNGTYYVVVQIDPHNYFLETNENNNVVAVPFTLTQQTPSGTATITANKNPNICVSDNITLTANAGTSYLWNTGATTQSITVSTAGNYTVTVTNICGPGTSFPFTVATYGPAAPTTTGDSICGSGSATLNANGAGTINWYSNSTGGSSLGTGTSYLTPVINATTNYYAESTTSGSQTYFCTPNANTIGGGGYYTGSQYLIFDVLSNCTLSTVKLYAQAAGSVTVQLQNSSGTVLNSVTLNVPAGESTQTLNFPLTTGSDYRLTRSGSFALYRNNAGVSYPYNVNGYVSIKNASAGSSFYYFFYNWKIVTPVQNCASLRAAATATVNTNPSAIITPNGPTAFCSGGSVTLSTPNQANRAYQWKKGGVDIAGATAFSYVATAGGTYKVTVTNTLTGCSKTTAGGTTVTVYSKPTATVTPQGPTSFCAGGSVLLSANTGAGLTYKWKKGVNYLAGATNSDYTAITAGTYKVEVTNSNGCSRTSAGVIVTVPCKETLNGVQNENAFYCEAHPNPSSNDFIIDMKGLTNEEVNITVYDIVGHQVSFERKNISADKINLSLLNSGIYSAVISNGENHRVIRLIKTK